MSEHHYREEMKEHAAEEQYKVAKDKACRLATKEGRLVETAGS